MKRCFCFLKKYIDKSRIENKIYGPFDIFEREEDLELIGNQQGVYFIVSKSRKYSYPAKTSPVIYIGKADHLKSRLKQHVRHYKDAMDIHKQKSCWIYSRYHYMTHGGAEVYYMPVSGQEKAKILESKALENFYDTYLALPVGNGAFSFR